MESLTASLARLRPPALGFCQILFQPTAPRHNWHRNVDRLLDLEFKVQFLSSGSWGERNVQQAPSFALLQKAREVETKAHGDKPFFAVALRLGVVGIERLKSGNHSFPGHKKTINTFIYDVRSHFFAPFGMGAGGEYYSFFT